MASRTGNEPIRRAKRRFSPVVESTHRLVRSVIVHVHHAGAAVVRVGACGRGLSEVARLHVSATQALDTSPAARPGQRRRFSARRVPWSRGSFDP
jgi:hypothetical protein